MANDSLTLDQVIAEAKSTEITKQQDQTLQSTHNPTAVDLSEINDKRVLDPRHGHHKFRKGNDDDKSKGNVQNPCNKCGAHQHCLCCADSDRSHLHAPTIFCARHLICSTQATEDGLAQHLITLTNNQLRKALWGYLFHHEHRLNSSEYLLIIPIHCRQVMAVAS